MKARELNVEHHGMRVQIAELTGRLIGVVEGGAPPLTPSWWLVLLMPDGAGKAKSIRCDDTTEITLGGQP